MAKLYDFNNKGSVEVFKCPYCGCFIRKSKLTIMYYYLLGKPLNLWCPVCGESWLCDLLIKTFYQFPGRDEETRQFLEGKRWDDS